MIKLENYECFGFEAAIRGMRNPMNSWEKSDSAREWPDCGACPDEWRPFHIGPNDLKLMKSLVKAGTDHRKFLRMINVTVDITAPLYWWKEFDTYKVGTVRNSCSTMHKIHEKEFTLDDFSHEHLEDAFTDKFGTICDAKTLIVLQTLINCLNYMRERYLYTKDKKYWWQMIQLLPSSYNQKATVQLNYEVLMNMYKSRKNHKLDEWHSFCEWIEKLPYMDEFLSQDKSR